MKLKYLSLFPDQIRQGLSHSLIQKAIESGSVSVEFIQIRDFALDRHRTVDDTPYGGGEGMVMRADVLHKAWQSAAQSDPSQSEHSQIKQSQTIFLTPQGKPFTQADAENLAKYKELIFVCGHYEGVDERFIETCVDQEYSIGDYVLTGGELPALVISDAVIRLLPGTVQNPDSLTEETFEQGLLKYPQYTRPADFLGMPVPPVLLSGDHGKIASFRKKERESRTEKRRPDLWEIYQKGKKD